MTKTPMHRFWVPFHGPFSIMTMAIAVVSAKSADDAVHRAASLYGAFGCSRAVMRKAAEIRGYPGLDIQDDVDLLFAKQGRRWVQV